MLTITTRNKWNATTNGTLICSACAVIVISAKQPGEVAMIMVAMGRSNAKARTTPTATEAIKIKNEFSSAKGMNSL